MGPAQFYATPQFTWMQQKSRSQLRKRLSRCRGF